MSLISNHQMFLKVVLSLIEVYDNSNCNKMKYKFGSPPRDCAINNLNYSNADDLANFWKAKQNQQYLAQQ